MKNSETIHVVIRIAPKTRLIWSRQDRHTYPSKPNPTRFQTQDFDSTYTIKWISQAIVAAMKGPILIVVLFYFIFIKKKRVKSHYSSL